MKKKARNYFIIYAFAFILFLVVDRLTKFLITNYLKNPIDLKILSIVFVKNTGAGFGILQNLNFLLIWISIIALGFIIIFYDRFPKIILVMITAGIIGNLIDRIFFGFVIDFINFKFWPVFNVADSLIVFGILGFIFLEIKKDLKKK